MSFLECRENSPIPESNSMPMGIEHEHECTTPVLKHDLNVEDEPLVPADVIEDELQPEVPPETARVCNTCNPINNFPL